LYIFSISFALFRASFYKKKKSENEKWQITFFEPICVKKCFVLYKKKVFGGLQIVFLLVHILFWLWSNFFQKIIYHNIKNVKKMYDSTVFSINQC
jgi:hypothetical protein